MVRLADVTARHVRAQHAPERGQPVRRRRAPHLLLATTLLFTNFELIVRDRPVLADELARLCAALEERFATGVRGRAVLRCGATTLFVDVALARGASPRSVCEAVAAVLGVGTRVALHAGKMAVDVAPLRLVA